MKTNATSRLDTLGIIISLKRGVDWTDVEIKTNILKLTTQHGYFISYHVMYWMQGHIVYILF